MQKSSFISLKKGLLFTLSFLFLQTMMAENPVAYVFNAGQWDDHILFKASVGGGYLFAEQDRITFVMSESDKIHHLAEENSVEQLDKVVLGRFSYQVEFIGSNKSANAIGQMPLTTYHNYFTSPDPAKWKAEVPLYNQVLYTEMYPKIDLLLKSKDHLFEYDFIIHPGADVNQIKMNYIGVKNVTIIDGQLYFNTPMGKSVELAPVVYQLVDGNKVAVKTRYIIHPDKTIGFEILEQYNTSKSLIIDPILVFSTYTGSFADNWGFTATYDESGFLYAGGMVSNQGYPTTIGAYDTLYSGGENFTQTDIGISKFSPDGANLIYSTYIGGTKNEIPHSLIVNEDNELIIYGTTGSFDYPVTLNAYDITFNGGPETYSAANINYLSGSDIILTKLNANGSNLLGSTFFGGTNSDGLNTTGNGSLEYNYGDFARGDIAIGADGDIYVASCTYSDDVEVGSTSFQSVKDGLLSGLVARFNSNLSQLRWATYLGGDGNDAAYTIELDGNEIIVAGGTSSANFPGINGLQPNFNGGQSDGYILKLNQDGITSNGGTYLGTAAYDQIYFLELDGDKNIYVYGQTLGNYPVSPNVFSVNNATQFIHKLNNSLNQSVYSTVFGSAHSASQTRRVNISPTAFLVDKCTNIYAVGWGGNVNNGYNGQTGRTNNLFVTGDAFSSTTDGSDFYIIVLEDDATNVQYATYFGENGGTGDHVDGGTSRFDKNGIVYHASCASCGQSQGFPTTPGVWSPDNLGSNCNMAAYKFRFEQAAVNAVFDADPVSGCPPLEVQFENFSSVEGDSYFWDFGDGDTSTLENPVHIFTTPGVYNVQFIITDLANCIVADTAYVEITVSGNTDVLADFIVNDSLCLSSNIEFINQSQNASNFLWDFGDGNTSTQENPIHTFTSEGTFLVTLYADPGSNCGDTATFEVSVFENVLDVDFLFTQSNCNDTTGVISFTGLVNANNGVQSILWNFGDGTTSTELSPEHSFVTGSYVVTLTVTDNVGCTNFVSDVIEVSTEPLEVSFEWTASCNPIASGVFFEAVVQTNANVTNYQWDFGNGFITNGTASPVNFYAQEGDYIVTLVVTTDLGCTATFIDTITVVIEQLNPNFTVEPITCGEATVQFVNTTTPIDSVIGYLWNFGDGTTSTEQNPNHTFPQVGNYFVSLTAFSSSGCQSTINLFVQMPLLNVSLVISAVPACDAVGVPIQFGVTGSSSSALTQFDWDFGDGTTAPNTFNISHSYSAPGTYLVQYVIANSNGCIDTLTQEIVIRDDLEVAIDFTRLGCDANNLSVDFGIDTEDFFGLSDATWNFGDGTIITGNLQPNHVYANSGTYTVILEAVADNGCVGTDTITLNLNAVELNAQFTSTTRGCPGRLIQFTNESTASEDIISFNWNFGDGNSSDVENPTHEYATTGNYSASLIITTINGCTDTFNLNIEVTEIVIDAAFDYSLQCDPTNLEVQFTDLSSSEADIISWNWNFGDGNTSEENEPSHVYANQGNYTVQLIIENELGCFDSISQTIEVETPALNASFAADTLICLGSSVIFDNSTFSESTIQSYAWDFGDGETSVEESPTYSYTASGNYEVTLVVSTIAGCIDTARTAIEVVEANGIRLEDTVSICAGDSIQLPLLGSQNQIYNWQPNQNLNNNTIAQPTASPPISTFYSVTVTETLVNGNTCTLNDGIWVIVNELPNVGATADPTSVIQGQTTNLNATGGVNYQWSPAQNLSNPAISNPVATIFEDITFTVTVIDQNGCENQAEISIQVIEREDCQFESLFVPNAFTPNGDGQNDAVFVRFQGNVDRLDFKIYNRWGELVFATDNKDIGWDGIFQGKLQSTDVFGYYLELECDQEIITQQGNITLVR
jgi:gliding motility-associated-like protein